uniref:Exosome complex component CSL4 C-terminal domain-containing protein n=1 Tax=Trichuris muris TaxID=70415 RepID=A0A5S6R3B6_TRIMR
MSVSDKFESLKGVAVVPGDKIVKCDPLLKVGKGCSAVHRYVYSTVLGFINVRSVMDGKGAVVEVEQKKSPQADLPTTGSIVTCRVLETTHKHAICAVLAVKNIPVRQPCVGLINKEATRPNRKELASILKSLGVQDIILAKVIGPCENQAYPLSIEDRSLGVVFGYCYMNHKMRGRNDHMIKCEACGIQEEPTYVQPQSPKKESIQAL